MNRQKFFGALVLSILLLAGPMSGRAGAGIVPGDFDNDCDVDAADFQHFRTCALGPAVSQTNPGCADTRLDGDADVDMDDFGIFQRCYSGENVPANPNCNRTCVGPNCNCLCGQTSCGGTCTNTASDRANCGACGNICAAGLTCVNGTCQACPAGSTLCNSGGVCTDIDWDNANCGGCGIVCPVQSACAFGVCEGLCIGCQ